MHKKQSNTPNKKDRPILQGKTNSAQTTIDKKLNQTDSNLDDRSTMKRKKKQTFESEIKTVPSEKSSDTEKYQKNGLEKNKSKANQIISNSIKSAKEYSSKYVEEMENNDDGIKTFSQEVKGTSKATKKTVNKSYQLVRDRTRRTLKKREFKKLQSAKGVEFTKADVKKHLKENFRKPKQKKLKTASKNVFKNTSAGVSNVSKNAINSLENNDDGVKIALQESKAISKFSSKLGKNSKKLITKNIKAKKQNVNLSKSTIKKMDQQKKLKLKRKSMKKRMLAPSYKKKFFEHNVVNRVLNVFKSFKKLGIKQLFARVMATKVMTALFGSLGGILAGFLLLSSLILLVVGTVSGAANEEMQKEEQGGTGTTSKNLSFEVESWRTLVEREAKAQNMSSYVNLILAIIQVETGGKGTKDIMQSSESAGYPMNYFQTEEESVRQGIKHLKNILNILKGYNKNYESNMKLMAQSYNFGVAFASFVGNRGGDYTLQVAEDYSRTVVAPSLGNTTGATIPYVNDTSIKLGKTYRYINGGNFIYGEIVSEYLGFTADGDYTLPVDNPVITSGYGSRTDPITGASGAFHRGLDFGNAMGTPIKAIQSGKVITAGVHSSWGNHVVILHGDGKISLYAHQSQMLVQVGDVVTGGQVIGKIGSTGDSTGPHLHLEIAKSNNLSQGNLIDPAIVLGIN